MCVLPVCMNDAIHSTKLGHLSGACSQNCALRWSNDSRNYDIDIVSDDSVLMWVCLKIGYIFNYSLAI